MKKWKVVLVIQVLLLVFPFCNILVAETSTKMGKQEEIVTLPEKVVVATREEEEITRIPGNVTVITSDDIERSVAKDIPELLRSESGIMVTNTSGSTPTGITVEARGFNNGGGNGGRTLVLIDGWKANRADTGSPDWASIPLSNVERIEIIRGPVSAIYGDCAMAGVINIITKSGIDGPAIDLGADVGSWRKFGQKFAFQGTTEAFKYYVNGNHSAEKGYRDNSNFRVNDLSSKFSYQLNPVIELNAKISLHDDDRELPGSLTESDLSVVGRRGSVTPADSLETNQHNIGLAGIFIPDENNEFAIRFYRNKSDRDSLSSIPGAGYTSINDDEHNHSLSLQYSLSHSIRGRGNKAVIGVDILKEEVESQSFSNFPDPLFPFIQKQTTNYKRELVGFFFHDSLSLTDKLIFDAGIRYDRGSFDYDNRTEDLASSTTTSMNGGKDFHKYSPKAAMIYLFTDGVSGYLSYARTFRFPNRDELTGFWGSTPQLDPEKGENFEIGMKAHLGSRFKGGISVYHMKVEDEILYRPPAVGTFAFGQNENFDEVIHKGLELSIDAITFQRATIFGSYTFVDTEIEEGPFEGGTLPITPRHMGTIGAILDLGWGFSFWNQIRFVGKRYLADDLSNSKDKLPKFHVWDSKLNYEYKGNRGKISAFFGVNNVLNKKYNEYGGVGGYPFGSRIGFYPSPERNFTVGVTFRGKI
ncbi:MAG: TonB-dependent receptor [Deltaproteobacteria bacterium]|nr:TonB-dependent receptor [Deltaproteobacteria bacterium]MBW2043735.1 TonB-dependent receptor [Deltaproteobacteria bacterium]MBW2299899.1 TonB-dependent receptor [Deltaproteobacteria bacterium]